MIITEVNPKEYKISDSNEEIIFTEGLEGCIGLAFFEKEREKIKRGLAHIFFGGSTNDNEFYEEAKKSEDMIEEICLNFKNPKVGLIYVPFKYDQDKLVNPLADYLKEKIIQKNIEIPIINDEIISPSKRHVYTKDLIFQPKKIRVVYKDRAGKRTIDDMKDYDITEYL